MLPPSVFGDVFKGCFKEARKKNAGLGFRACQSGSIGRKGQIGLLGREEEKGHEEEGGQKPEKGYPRQPPAQCGSTLRQVCLVDHHRDH